MKLSLDALKERAVLVASNDLLATISGGTNNDCHDSTPVAAAPAAPAAPTVTAPSSSFELKADIKYDSKTGGVQVGVGGIWKF